MTKKKICMLGASSVGKTSLVRQFVEGVFSETYLTTIGVKIDKKTVSLSEGEVQFVLWDVEGVDAYSGFNPKYLRGAAGCIIVVDRTRFPSLTEGLEILKLAEKANPNLVYVLAVNKSDLEGADDWSIDQMIETNRFSLTIETSAKTGSNVEEMFTGLASLLIDES